MIGSQPARRLDAEAIVAHCIGFVADMLERSPRDIDPHAKFARIGLDSANSVQLLVSLEQLLDQELEPDLIAEHPTISSLAARLAELGAHSGKAGS